jgi:DNA polymerase
VVSLPVRESVSAKPVIATRSPHDMTPTERLRELEHLARMASGCTLCPQLAPNRTQVVFGTGPLDPPICFVGEAPGAGEDRSGLPFVGESGEILNGILRDVGLDRDEVYIANILKCHPPGNRKPVSREVSNCRTFLDRQIALVRPRALCALGGTAAQNLLDTTETIGRLRGRLHEYKGTLVLCTYHPAFLLPDRSPDKRRDVVRDVVMLMRRLGLAVPRGY